MVMQSTVPYEPQVETPVRTFSHATFGNIRTVLLDDDPWFFAVDVCRVLSIANARDAYSTLDEDETRIFQAEQQPVPAAAQPSADFLADYMATCGFTCSTSTVAITDTAPIAAQPSAGFRVVSESGLYALVFRSRKPAAKAFRKWVTSEVLPSIRKTGTYGVPQDYLSALRALVATEEAKQQLQQQLVEANQRVLQAEAALGFAGDYVQVKGLPWARQYFVETSGMWVALGRQLHLLGDSMNLPPTRVPDSTWGSVYAHHRMVCESLRRRLDIDPVLMSKYRRRPN